MKRSRLIAAGLALGIAAGLAAILAPRFGAQSPNLSALKKAEVAQAASGSLRQRFELLSRRHTNQCALRPESLEAISTRGRLQGSCCMRMVYSQYVRQVRGLRAFASEPGIPADPYDISVALAKRLVAYDRSMTLSPTEQATYDAAVKRSDEHGPCCCRCWRWTAFRGQAKELIARRRYSAAEVAKVWNLEDGCGGGDGERATG